MTLDDHTTLASMLFKQIAIGADEEDDAIAVLEAVTLGLLILYRGPHPADQIELLDAMTERLREAIAS